MVSPVQFMADKTGCTRARMSSYALPYQQCMTDPCTEAIKEMKIRMAKKSSFKHALVNKK